MITELVLFLDKDAYPDHDLIASSLSRGSSSMTYSLIKDFSGMDNESYSFNSDSEMVFHPVMESTILAMTENLFGIQVFSIYPDLVDRCITSLKALTSGHESLTIMSLMPYVSKADFNEFTREVRSMNSELLIPKLRLSTDEVDTLKLAEMFNISPATCVKYQVKGETTRILNYKGLSSFSYINDLNSGVITPATDDEYRTVYTSEKVLPKDTLIQFIPGHSEEPIYSEIVTKYNEDNGLYWYECNFDSPATWSYKLPLEEPTFYIYIKRLDKDYMSSLCQGVHPLLVNKLKFTGMTTTE